MELKGASLSSAARGEVSWERGIEWVLCETEDGGRSGVSWGSSRIGCRRRWMTASLELTEPAAEQAGRVVVQLCPSQREEEDGLTAWARVVRGTSEGVQASWCGAVKWRGTWVGVWCDSSQGAVRLGGRVKTSGAVGLESKQ